MNEDLISREALKKAVNKADFDFGCYYDHTCDTQEMVNRIIDNAPTVEQPTGEWIPVKERLPTKTGLYLVSIDDLVTTLNYAGTCFVNRGGVRVDVDAWMTLPNPYRKGGEKNEVN